MELKEKNIFAICYKWVYDKLPDNFCDFFWNFVIAILLFPFVIPGKIYNKISERYNRGILDTVFSGILVYLTLIVFCVIGLAVLTRLYTTEELSSIESIWLALLVSIVVGIVFFSIVVLIIGVIMGLIELLKDLTSRTKTSHSKKMLNNTNKLKIMTDNIRKKYCTKITWIK